MDMEESGMREECGVFGCIASGEWPTQLDVPHVITAGLGGLQHRPITKGPKEAAKLIKLVTLLQPRCSGQEVSQAAMWRLRGLVYICVLADVMQSSCPCGRGAADNCSAACEYLDGCELLRHGIGLYTSSDSEMITQLLAYTPPQERDNTPDWVARIKNLMKEAPTAYSLLIMHRDVIYAVRDPYGNRPLCIGRLIPASDMNDKEKKSSESAGWVVSSESGNFLSIGARYSHEVKPGEIVEISRHGVRTLDTIPRSEGDPVAFCIFEYVYFARPDSIFEGQMVYTVRYRCGQQLAIEAPVEADLVSTVPESATPAALGYAAKSGLPYVEVLCKNRYVGRTFIQPNMRLRQLGVAKKFGVLTDNFKGKRVVLVDDSIVRGNTISPIIRLLKESGAKEVHIRVASPPIKYPCFMGINIPTKEELIANKPEFDRLAEYLGANSVMYLSVEGLVSSVQQDIKFKKQKVQRHDITIQENGNGLECFEKTGHCTACLTGQYPVELEW
ncbi:hypothetical protein U0070_016444 [Myodes glareolus]|uniref:Amidophosphoribosyltransferase n=1 Tax=Myodes glareolus TaxID=447135 RepID=A0AAW0JXQ2_MYOGA